MTFNPVCLNCDYWLKRDNICRYDWKFPSCEDNEDPPKENDEEGEDGK